jgi:hypothetical protein
MSMSAINSASPANSLLEVQKQAPAPVAATTSSAQLPTDTVSLSPTALKASGGDVDHDGDSH